MPHSLTAIVTLVALLLYVAMGIAVGRTRYKTGVQAPAMTGDPLLERAIRVQANTLEWLPVFLGSLWLFAIYWNERVAAGIGVVWILGRIVYWTGYMAAPEKRGPGFLIQMLAAMVLLLGALGRVVYVLMVAGG
jgi:uncharacterized membrane protein YecN with MAPEG domain